MNPQRAATLLTAIFALCACANQPAANQPLANMGLHSLQLQPRFEKSNGAVVNSKSLPSKQIFDFRLKPGTFLGGNLAGTFDLQGLTKDAGEFTVDLDTWMQPSAAQARPLAESSIREGIQITPSETRIGQILPLAYSKGDGRIGGRFLGTYSYFRDAEQRWVQLMFFDRTCQVSGTLHLDSSNAIVTVDLKIDGPGFYFLEFVEGLRGKHQLAVAPGLSIVDFVTVF